MLEHGEVLVPSLLDEAGDQLIKVQSVLSATLATLLNLRLQAQKLSDRDYWTYGSTLEELGMQYREACEHMRK